MSNERSTDERVDEQNGEPLSAVQPPSDPDLERLLDPPKKSREPGLPPPRD
ncbi:MAG: hypothetical protein ACRDNH_06055 [Gaiellaceae bacterium]